jgi:hypothetical protein
MPGFREIDPGRATLEIAQSHVPESLMLSQSIPAPSSRLSALSNRGGVYAVLALGLAGLLTELVSAVFVPRLVLYLAVLVFGGVGVVRCRRAAQRSAAQPRFRVHADADHNLGTFTVTRRSRPE